MKTQLQQLSFNISHLDPRLIRLVFIILSLALFAIGAGAPTSGGELGG